VREQERDGVSKAGDLVDPSPFGELVKYADSASALLKPSVDRIDPEGLKFFPRLRG
jgi:hypothetical protein